eukprot:TRINITY_DN2482_c0_g1_i1.p1 TRINITY_DN2482_c0_g1~~TRINITY_DN2482_c0_g1_i1.p1  ORF type:complete len:326 (-),score=92.60 TRINITY_DN2482_c0_g1_i1:129-1106(-)
MDSLSQFVPDAHLKYLENVGKDKNSFESCLTQHLRISGAYWTVSAQLLLNADDSIDKEALVEWILSCQHSNGGFGGDNDHDAHMLYTLSAIQLLAICDALDRVDKDRIAEFVISLMNEDGSFYGDKWGEKDTRFSYCATASLALIGQLDKINKEKVIEFVLKCQNFDGGFGLLPGAESHAGQMFCCVGTLSILNAIDRMNVDSLAWWLSERQCDSGGLNGRPEKQADVCYSWWVISCLKIIDRLTWIDGNGLMKFILACQDKEDGGIADRPGDMADAYHTFFGIAGLNMLGYFDKYPLEGELKTIDPTFALPTDIIKKIMPERFE